MHNSPWELSYRRAFRRHAHQLLAWGYSDAKRLISPNNEETDITGFIVEAIKKRLDNINTPDCYDRFDVEEDGPFSGEGRIGKSRRRTDIIIKHSSSRPRAKYIFEAKRLKKKSHLISGYTGSDGLQRFLNGIYASDLPEAAMIGYVQNKTIRLWQNELETELKNDGTGQYKIIEQLRQLKETPLIKTWISSHSRKQGSIIDICHIFLDCTN